MAKLLADAGYPKVVTYTSRLPRDGELNRIDYNFDTRARIEALYRSGVIWEVEEFCGNLYGSPEIRASEDVCIVLEANGAMRYKAHYGDLCFAVLLVASREELSARICSRDNSDELLYARQLECLPDEVLFDMVVDTTNKLPEQVVKEVLEGVKLRLSEK